MLLDAEGVLTPVAAPYPGVGGWYDWQSTPETAIHTSRSMGERLLACVGPFARIRWCSLSSTDLLRQVEKGLGWRGLPAIDIPTLEPAARAGDPQDDAGEADAPASANADGDVASDRDDAGEQPGALTAEQVAYARLVAAAAAAVRDASARNWAVIWCHPAADALHDDVLADAGVDDGILLAVQTDPNVGLTPAHLAHMAAFTKTAGARR